MHITAKGMMHQVDSDHHVDLLLFVPLASKASITFINMNAVYCGSKLVTFTLNASSIQVLRFCLAIVPNRNCIIVEALGVPGLELLEIDLKNLLAEESP